MSTVGLSQIEWSPCNFLECLYCQVIKSPKKAPKNSPKFEKSIDVPPKFGTYVGEHAIALTGNSSQSQDGRIGRKAEVAEGGRVRFGLASTVYR